MAKKLIIDCSLVILFSSLKINQMMVDADKINYKKQFNFQIRY